MIVAGESHLEAQCRGYVVGVEHVALAALVHGYAGLVEPSLLLEVSLEGGEEIVPQLFICSRACRCCDIFLCAGGLVLVAETHVPWHHTEAAYLLVDAALGAELHVTVEDGVVVGPLSVCLLCGDDHRLKLVVTLLAPWFVEHYCRDGALSGSGESFKIGSQGFYVLVAPRLHAVITAHGVGLLPQVEVELLIFHLRQSAVGHTNDKRQRGDNGIGGISNFEFCFINSCCCIAWHLQGAPHGTRLHGWHIVRSADIDDVGNKPRYKVCRVIAAALIVVGDDVVHKASVAPINACGFPIFDPFCHLHRHASLVGLAIKQRLHSHALSSPSPHRVGDAFCQLWHTVQ